ncbi:hypothetical protein PMI08_03641 [Brevibacillus sp. CF112]|nr:hypothetical protein PMI08_03641 [Brevibacillus sp. CF112]
MTLLLYCCVLVPAFVLGLTAWKNGVDRGCSGGRKQEKPLQVLGASGGEAGQESQRPSLVSPVSSASCFCCSIFLEWTTLDAVSLFPRSHAVKLPSRDSKKLQRFRLFPRLTKSTDQGNPLRRNFPQPVHNPPHNITKQNRPANLGPDIQAFHKFTQAFSGLGVLVHLKTLLLLVGYSE